MREHPPSKMFFLAKASDTEHQGVITMWTFCVGHEARGSIEFAGWIEATNGMQTCQDLKWIQWLFLSWVLWSHHVSSLLKFSCEKLWSVPMYPSWSEDLQECYDTSIWYSIHCWLWWYTVYYILYLSQLGRWTRCHHVLHLYSCFCYILRWCGWNPLTFSAFLHH